MVVSMLRGVERLMLVIHIYWLPTLADPRLIYARQASPESSTARAAHGVNLHVRYRSPRRRRRRWPGPSLSRLFSFPKSSPKTTIDCLLLFPSYSLALFHKWGGKKGGQIFKQTLFHASLGGSSLHLHHPTRAGYKLIKIGRDFEMLRTRKLMQFLINDSQCIEISALPTRIAG